MGFALHFMAIALTATGLAQAAEPALLRDWKAPGRGHVFTATFSPDGTLLATGTALSPAGDCAVHLWDTASGELRRTITAAWSVSAVAFSPDGKQLAVGCGTFGAGDVSIHDLSSGKLLWKDSEFCRHSFTNPVIFVEKGKTLAHFGRESGEGGIVFRSVATGEVVRKLPAEDGAYSMALSPEGRILAVGSWDHGFIRLWDLSTGKVILTLQHEEGRKPGSSAIVTSLSFTPDGKHLVSGLEYRTVRVWSLESREPTATFKTSMRFEQIALALDSKTLVAGLHAIDLPDGALRFTLPDAERADRGAVAISPDGKLLATGGRDSSIRLWKLKE